MTLLKNEAQLGLTSCAVGKTDASTGGNSILARLRRAIGSRGLLATLALVPKNILWAFYRWRDTRFDRRYGVDTSGHVGLQFLDVVGGNRDGCNYYAPAPVKTMRRIYAALPVDPGQYTFVDVGAGKGRPVLLASVAGFRRVIGVEFSPELAEVARRNAALFRTRVRVPAATEVEVVCDDATKWPIPAEDCVLFLFNPFAATVMRAFLDNVARSYRAHDQHIVIAYYHPTCAAVLDEVPFLTSKSYTKLPFDPTPENTFEVGTAGHGVGIPYDLIIYETEPQRRGSGES